MNRTKIEWCDYTWNPVTGCKHNCPYCYARKIAQRFNGSKAWPNGFEPTFHNSRLPDPKKMKTPQIIFVCSMSDLFGDWVPDSWIIDVMLTAKSTQRHTYIFLTKNPMRYHKIPKDFLKQKNFWFGATVTNQNDTDNIFILQQLQAENKFISFEPLSGLINHDLSSLDWIIIGAQTNPLKLPNKEWVQELIDRAKILNIPVFMKNSLKSLGIPMIQEYPESFLKGDKDHE